MKAIACERNSLAREEVGDEIGMGLGAELRGDWGASGKLEVGDKGCK